MKNHPLTKPTGGHTCEVCGYAELQLPPRDSEGNASLEICPSCGYQPGYDDDCLGRTIEETRARWVDGGRTWWSTRKRPES